MTRDYKGLLVGSIEVIAFVTSAFGGFIINVAPPDQSGASYSVGIASFVLLTILLIVSALGKHAGGRAKRKSWIITGMVCLGLAIAAAFVYSSELDRYTYWYPPEKPSERHVQASVNDLTYLAKDYILRNPNDSSAAELERNLPTDQIWNNYALAKIRSLLLVTYLCLVMTLATGVFSLIEANYVGVRSRTAPKEKKAT